MKKLSLIAACLLAPVACALATDVTVTTLANTNQVKFTASPVAKALYLDCRGMLPAASTVSVLRTSSGGISDTLASVVCADGLGRAAVTNTWYPIRNEYLRYTGATNGTVKVVCGP